MRTAYHLDAFCITFSCKQALCCLLLSHDHLGGFCITFSCKQVLCCVLLLSCGVDEEKKNNDDAGNDCDAAADYLQAWHRQY